MLEPDGVGRLTQVQLYLSVGEAQEIVEELKKLLHDPEANKHFHVFSKGGGCELSVSIVTQAKLRHGGIHGRGARRV
jgi:hypothetical protein